MVEKRNFKLISCFGTATTSREDLISQHVKLSSLWISRLENMTGWNCVISLFFTNKLCYSINFFNLLFYFLKSFILLGKIILNILINIKIKKFGWVFFSYILSRIYYNNSFEILRNYKKYYKKIFYIQNIFCVLNCFFIVKEDHLKNIRGIQKRIFVTFFLNMEKIYVKTLSFFRWPCIF
jgi:mRNA-degrading endonuclease HigB of HigAB toxin-antitoxin module